MGFRIVFLYLISGFTSGMFNPLPAQIVQHRGAARNVMMGVDLRATVQLDSLLRQPHFFGLGPVDDLQGEITVIDGNVYVSSILSDGSQFHRRDSSVRAPFLAFAYAENWEVEELWLDLQDWDALQHWIQLEAEKKGWPAEHAFPFRLEGQVDYLNYHIIRRDVTKKEHNHDLHQQAKVRFEWEGKHVQLLGFYSTQHEGIFTQKGQYMHLHGVDPQTGSNGHVDNLRLTGLFKVYWPEVN